ncbi:MAG TPA: FkbM family methyltransferase, partial [Candidatus Binatia bacterium]|nr:FkbM family methyltransferase [Candidatus Binatia bacterium]
FYGFEPLPGNYEVCQLNYRNLEGAEVFPWALGARSGRASFEFSEQDPRGGQIREQAAAGGHLRIEVEVRTMAEVMGKLEAPDFVKIDVEGAELEVLRGLGQEARRVKRMLVETHGEELEVGCLRWMLDNGFAVRHLHEAVPGWAAIWADRVGRDF